MSALSAERSAAAGGLILVLRFAAASVLNYAFGVALAWLLVPGSFGSVSAVQNLLLLAAGALSAGLPWALASKIAANGSDADSVADLRTAVLGNLGLSLALSALLLGGHLAGVHVIPGQSLALVLTVAVTLPVLGINTVLAGALIGSRRFGGIGAMASGEILIKCVVALALVELAGVGAVGVAFGFLVGAVAATAIAVRALRGLLPTVGSWQGSLALARLRTFAVALPIWASTVSFTILLTADLLALGLASGSGRVTAATLATYQVCAILARAPYYVTDALIDAVFPFMAGGRSRQETHGWFMQAVRWVPLVIVPLQLALVLTPSLALRLFFPDEYGDARLLLQLITIGTLGLLLTNMLVKGLFALQRAGEVARRMPWTVLVEGVGLLVLVPSHGAVGAATAYCLAGWSGALLLAPLYLRAQRVGRLPTVIVVRYAVALVPNAALIAASRLVSDAYAYVLVAVAMLLFAAQARSLGLFNEQDDERVRAALGWLRGGRRAAQVDRAMTVVPTAPAMPVPTVPAPTVPAPIASTPIASTQTVLAPEPTVATAPAQPRPPAATPPRPPAAAPVRTRAQAAPVDRRREWALAAGCGLLAAVALLVNLFGSPDIVYDEVVYGEAARNIATGWHLTWTNQPMLVHPPMSFLLQAGWLRLSGQTSSPLIDGVHLARVLTAVFGAVNVMLLSLLAYRLAESASVHRRQVLTLAVAVLAGLDPVLLRYSRLAIIEPFALCFCLLTLLAAWTLRERSTLSYVAGVGLPTGLALLTKECTVFLVIVPLGFALLERDRRLLRGALGALGVGLAFWLVFPLWAVQLGLTSSFVDVQTATLQRLVGIVQNTGWNQPGASFTDAVRRSVTQYASSYALLATGSLTLLWMWWRRRTPAASFLTAWLTAGYGFAAYVIGIGTLNEQFFVYVLPAAIVGTVFAADALLTQLGHGVRRRERLARRVAVPAVALFGALMVLASSSSWGSQYVARNNGIEKITSAIATTLPACSIVNVSGDAEKYSLLLGGRPVTLLAQGPAALSVGVHDFVLSPHDALARYGNMSPELEAWIRANGTRTAAFPSSTYEGLELWRVDSSPYDPLSDIEYVDSGVYVTTVGSRCGGFSVTDSSQGSFSTAYAALGGKAMVGAPRSRPSAAADGAVQVFDGVVLQARPGSGDSSAAPLPLVAELARSAPDRYREAGLPPVAATPAQPREWLTDPDITRAYLGGGTDLDDATIEAAIGRFGAPLGPPVAVDAEGSIAQPFAGAVLTRSGAGAVHLAPVGRLAVEAGLVALPADAARPQPAPPLPRPQGPTQPTNVRPFVQSLLVALLGFGLVVGLLHRRGRRVRAERTLGAVTPA